jgi:hypothetical protein
MTRGQADKTWRLLRQISRRVQRAAEREEQPGRKEKLQTAAMRTEAAVMGMLCVVDSLPRPKTRRKLW